LDGPFRLDRVIEKLATLVTLTIERQPEGKMRVTSGSWDHERVFTPDQVLEVRVVNSRLYVTRKDRHHDAAKVAKLPDLLRRNRKCSPGAPNTLAARTFGY
jgi:hypothetical protein